MEKKNLVINAVDKEDSRGGMSFKQYIIVVFEF